MVSITIGTNRNKSRLPGCLFWVFFSHSVAENAPDRTGAGAENTGAGEKSNLFVLEKYRKRIKRMR
jgi:hypothetical protein